VSPTDLLKEVGQGGAVTEVEVTTNRDVIVQEADLKLSREATYLTWLRLVDDDGRASIHSLSCLEPVRQSAWLWGAYSEDLGTIWRRLDRSRPEEHVFRSFIVGLVPSHRYRWLGATVGYGVTRREGVTPPSWADVSTADNYDEAGRIDYSIVRRSLLVGLTLQADTELVKHLSLFARPSLFTNFGIVELGAVPQELAEFRETKSDSTFDFDVAVIAQGGVSWQVHPSFALDVFGHVTVPEVVDATRGGTVNEPQIRVITYDGNVIGGIGLGFRVMR
jgi:hypothetical protein